MRQYKQLKMESVSRFVGEKYVPLLVLCAFILTAVMVSFSPHIAMAAKAEKIIGQAQSNEMDPTLVLTLGKGDVIDIEGPMSDVMIADPSIIDVQALQSKRLYIVGTSLGDTNMIVLDAHGNVLKRLNVHVRVDITTIQSNLNTFFPDEDVTVSTINDQIVLTGSVSNPDIANRIQNFAVRFAAASGSADPSIVNMMNVEGKQQVMLQVKILELSRSALRELGLEASANAGDSTGGHNLGLALDVATQTGLTAQNPFAVASIIRDSGLSSLGLVQFLINALEDRDLVKTLAEPNLTAISGEQAGFLAGGEFPIPQGRSESGDVVVELQEFGVSLNFRPVVLTHERISLQLETEVSSISYENAVEISNPPITVPGRSVRRANTTVEMGSGRTLMIAGLIQSDTIRSMAGLPGIIDTPVIGDLVKSRSFSTGETELVIMITPYIVEPYANEEHAEREKQPSRGALEMSFINNLGRVYGDRVPKVTNLDNFGYVID